jgi:hypothetical protein
MLSNLGGETTIGVKERNCCIVKDSRKAFMDVNSLKEKLI